MTDLVPIVVQGISWSQQHGQPLVLLRGLGTDCWFAVSADVEEARAFSSCTCAAERTRRRLARLASQLLRVAGGEIEQIVLRVDGEQILRAHLLVRSSTGTTTVETFGLDALVLAAELGIMPVMRWQELAALAASSQRAENASDETATELPPAIQRLLAELEERGFGTDDSR